MAVTSPLFQAHAACCIDRCQPEDHSKRQQTTQIGAWPKTIDQRGNSYGYCRSDGVPQTSSITLRAWCFLPRELGKRTVPLLFRAPNHFRLVRIGAKSFGHTRWRLRCIAVQREEPRPYQGTHGSGPANQTLASRERHVPFRSPQTISPCIDPVPVRSPHSGSGYAYQSEYRHIESQGLPQTLRPH